MEAPPLAGAQGREQLELSPLSLLPRPGEGAPARAGQLDPVPAPIRGIRPPGEELSPLHLVENGDEVAGMDAKRARQAPLVRRPLCVEVMQNRELRPPEPARAQAPAHPPGGGAREAKDQQAAAGVEGGLAGCGVRRGGPGGGTTHVDSYIS